MGLIDRWEKVGGWVREGKMRMAFIVIWDGCELMLSWTGCLVDGS